MRKGGSQTREVKGDGKRERCRLLRRLQLLAAETVREGVGCSKWMLSHWLSPTRSWETGVLGEVLLETRNVIGLSSNSRGMYRCHWCCLWTAAPCDSPVLLRSGGWRCQLSSTGSGPHFALASGDFPQFQVFLLGGPKFLVGQEPTFLYFSGVNHLHQAPLPHQIICLE